MLKTCTYKHTGECSPYFAWKKSNDEKEKRKQEFLKKKKRKKEKKTVFCLSRFSVCGHKHQDVDSVSKVNKMTSKVL